MDSSGVDSTQILPNLSKEKRRSVSVTRQQKVETAKMVAPNLEQESSDQIQPIISNERKRSVSVTRQDQVEIAENLKNLTNVAKQTKSAKPKQIKDKHDSIAVVDDEKLESTSTLQIEKPKKRI